MAFARDPNNAIPIMTNNTAPSGVASASNENQPAWWAMNGTTQGWCGIGSTGWLEYAFAAAFVATQYNVTSPGDGMATGPEVKTWTFEGWNGVSWTVLDTQSLTAHSGAVTQKYVLNNSTAYLAYRLNISANFGEAWISVAAFEILGSNYTNHGFLTQLLNGVLTGLHGAAQNALAYFDGSKWAIKEGGTTGQVLGIDTNGAINWLTQTSGSSPTVASQADVIAGKDNTKMVTPLALQEKLSQPLLAVNGTVAMQDMLSGFHSDTGLITGRLGALWAGSIDEYGEEPLIGFPHNQFAFLTSSGGSVSSSPGPLYGSLDNMFDGTGASAQWNPTGNVAVTVVSPTALSYMRQLMIQFRADNYPTAFTIEHSPDGVAWTTGFSITGWTRDFFCANTDSTWYNTLQLRFTATAYCAGATYFSLIEFGWTNYALPTDSYSLSRLNGGTVCGDINLPAGNNFTIDGVPLAAPTVAPAASPPANPAANALWIVSDAPVPSVLTTDGVGEGLTHLYHTDARVIAAGLTGLATANNSAVIATDSVVAGVGKLQAQCTNLNQICFVLTIIPQYSLCSPSIVMPCDINITDVYGMFRTVNNAAQIPSSAISVRVYKDDTLWDTRTFAGSNNHDSGLLVSYGRGTTVDIRLPATNGLNGLMTITFLGYRI